MNTNKRADDSPTEKTVVIGRMASCNEGECTVPVLQFDAVDLAKTYDAIALAKTWRDFRHACGDRLWNLFRDHIDGSGFSLPGDDEVFDLLDIPGFADGDWPKCPRQNADQWLPSAAMEFAKRYDTLLNAELIEFAVEDEAALVSALERDGFSCLRQDDLVRKACGLD